MSIPSRASAEEKIAPNSGGVSGRSSMSMPAWLAESAMAVAARLSSSEAAR
jgi:hypothetical protein